MKLYHGTSGHCLATILKDGIRPRGKTGGNWKRYPSRRDMVYLTTAYAFYFAIFHPKGGDAVVLEIDTRRLDQSLLFPDEDFIVQREASDDLDRIAVVHKRLKQNLDGFQDQWSVSVSGLGTCAYRGVIQPEAIERYCVFRPEERPGMAIMVGDPELSIRGHAFNSKKYRAVTAWFFGDRKTLPPDIPRGTQVISTDGRPLPREICDAIKANRSFVAREVRDRAGINVVAVSRSVSRAGRQESSR